MTSIVTRIRRYHLAHYVYHFIIANLGLYISIRLFGSVTMWEILLFVLMSYVPVIDEFIFAIITYLDQKESRDAVNLLIIGNIGEMLSILHKERLAFTRLIIHNVPVYLSLLSLLFASLVFDFAILFFGVMGILVHLAYDITNDHYEFGTLNRWFWPFRLFYTA